MTVNTFVVKTDGNGRKFVEQYISEKDKNHGVDDKIDDTTGEGRMYGTGGDMCPVQSYEKYLSKLPNDTIDLWLRPLDSFYEEDDVWYYKAPLGKNTLGKMMSDISAIAGLSVLYTNHCIRTTNLTEVDNAGIEARHIMRVS
jgi:hypothetical protein